MNKILISRILALLTISVCLPTVASDGHSQDHGTASHDQGHAPAPSGHSAAEHSTEPAHASTKVIEQAPKEAAKAEPHAKTASADHGPAHASANHDPVPDKVLDEQQEALEHNTHDKGFGPQSPRDISDLEGTNPVVFHAAPAHTKMNLCNIHFHRNAEHKGGEFSEYVGNGDGHGFGTGFHYSGNLTAQELQPLASEACASEHGGLKPGDTIELHYVHSSAQVKPGPTLAACLSESVKNPQLRVEAQVLVLVNDRKALDFSFLTDFGIINNYHQAINIPTNTGTPVEYAGSTTGPNYNEQGSPFQVSWRVRPKVAKVDIKTIATWCTKNAFNEDHGHGVRNLVTNPELLSPIKTPK